MRRIGALVLLSAGSLSASSDLRQFQREAENFAKAQTKFTLEQVELFSEEEIADKKEAPFDSKTARRQLEAGSTSELPEPLEFLASDKVQQNLRERRFNEDEYFFKRSEEISGNPIAEAAEEENVHYHRESCQEAAGPYPLTVVRTLQVEAQYTPGKSSYIRECQGHKQKKSFFWKSDAKDWVDEQKRRLSQDKNLRDYDVSIFSGGVFSKYKVKAEWWHEDGSKICDNYENRQRTQPEKWEELSENWSYGSEKELTLINSPDCTLVENICLDSSPKVIKGKEVHRQCWKEKLCFLCQFAKSNTCAILKDKNCLEVSRQCLKEGPYGCALWKVDYKCFDRIERRSTSTEGQFFELDIADTYEPNQSFSSVLTKLQVFAEAKKQLEEQEIKDASKVALFPGKKKKCSKSVADKVLYDCCFSFGGLATDFKLSQCSEEEKELGALREREVCHYVGSYKKEFLDLWKSQDVHVFCCFPSKLARLFQEEARQQLLIDWGSPKHPNCRGLSIDEIAKVDFSKINLSEAYEIKAQAIESKLKQKMERIQSDLSKDDQATERTLKQKMDSLQGISKESAL